jgi:hypothetical protein
MADKPAAAEAAKKINPQVEALKKNHFWILAVALVITGFVVWYLGTGALADQFKRDAATNTSAFSSLMPYKAAGINSPPNAQYKVEVDKENDKLAKGVVSTWQTLYDRQAKILTMNERVGKDLADLILLDVNERADRFSKQSVAITAALENFHNSQVIETEFDQLFSMLNLRRPKAVPAAAPAADAPPVVGGPGQFDGVVVWAAPRTTQQMMQRYKTTKVPTVNRVAVTQEDIWIFKSLFGVIQNINQYSNDNWLSVVNGNPLPAEKPRIDQGNVAIKRIDFCDVAQYAMSRAFGDPGRIRPLTTEGNDNAIFMATGDGGVFTVPTTGDPSEDKILLTNRYIDSRNYPVADPATPPISEFRQVFLQLQVLMDQRIVPVLIAECAQAPFPIETRQVRMSLSEVDIPRQEDAARDQMNKVEQSPHDVTVTLRGVVYIYVKPDQKKLGQGSDKEPGKRDYGIPRKPDVTDPAAL